MSFSQFRAVLKHSTFYLNNRGVLIVTPWVTFLGAVSFSGCREPYNLRPSVSPGWSLLTVTICYALRVMIGQTNDPKDGYQALCHSYGFELYLGQFGREKHYLCLKSKHVGVSALASPSAIVLLDPEPSCDADKFPLRQVTMAYGFPAEQPTSGTADGYIGDDQHFYGVLHLGNRVLYSDPYGHDNGSNFSGFGNDNLVVSKSLLHEHVQSRSIDESVYSGDFPFEIQDHKPVPGVAKSRICDLLLLADKEFYEKEGNHSLQQVVKRMIHAVSQADSIFRNADFDENGTPDNIGFTVKYILVLTSTETNTRVFGDLLKGRVIDGREYLMKFARLRRLSEVCLGVAFSGHAFWNRTLGLSFTSLGDGIGGAAGGLCDRRAYGRSFNTLAISHATTESSHRVPERVAALTLAHEMGHSFGSHHDDNFPNPECRGFLMSSQSVAGDSSKHFEFSICSKRLVAATLSSMSYCLMEENLPYCGNGIVEVGEACDCGLPSRCYQKDPCCTPRSGGVQENGRLHIEGCSVAPKASCHPSQGLCCKSDCHFANLTQYGIECSKIRQQCPCLSDSGSSCPCGHEGVCVSHGGCEATECVSLGLRECTCKGNLGGTLGEHNLCGICCLLPQSEGEKQRCVSAEIAALYSMSKNLTLPNNWPNINMSGKPRIQVRLCIKDTCNTVLLRAWKPHGLCVTMNIVGSCTAIGECKPQFVQPNTNRYPDIYKLRYLQAFYQKKTASSLQVPVSLLCAIILVLYLIYT